LGERATAEQEEGRGQVDVLNGTNGIGPVDAGESKAARLRPRKERSYSQPYYAALGRLMARMGPVRMVNKTDPVEYERRLSAARRDLSTAGPHLRRAILTWRRRSPPAPLFTEDNDAIPEAFDAWLAHVRVFADAIDDDDEAELERQRTAAAVPVVNVTLPSDALAPVASQLAELVAVAVRQEASVARLADQLAPEPTDKVDTRWVADRLKHKSTQGVAAMASDGMMPDDCKVPGTGNGTPWQFWRKKVEAWIVAGRPPARGKKKRG
jgi:hypothetical protein